MNKLVNHPAHYNQHPSGVECIQIVRWFNFNLGNVIKYVWRAGLKTRTDKIEDLEKAVFYLQDEIDRLKAIEIKNNAEAKEQIKAAIDIIALDSGVSAQASNDNYINSIKGHHYDSD